MVTPSNPPPSYEQLLPLPTPCFEMFMERSLNGPHPHLPLQAPFTATPLPIHHPFPPKNFDHTLLICMSDKANIALFSKLSNCYFDVRPPGQIPGQDRGAKTRPQGPLECANPRGSPGGWSGLELADTFNCCLTTGINGSPDRSCAFK